LEGGIVNLREAIEEYANAVSARDYYDNRLDAQRVAEVIRECWQDLDVLLAVAEAAIAYMDYDADNERDAEVIDGTYVGRRCELWDAFVVARDKAKAANQS
jgi:arsenate reductase-like glutaredoxin family protein